MALGRIAVVRTLARGIRATTAPATSLVETLAGVSDRALPPSGVPSSSSFELAEPRHGPLGLSSALWSRGFAAKKKSKGRRGKDKDAAAAPAAEEEIAEAGAEGEEPEVDVFELCESERDACYENLESDFATLRPNRATSGMLDHLVVPAYDDQMPLKHLASSNVRDVSTLVVSVFDPQMTKAVERAILESPLGLNPISEGQEIVVRVPPPTEESRQQMCKIIRSQAEQAKVRMRKARQRAMQVTKKQISDKDERKATEKELENFFDEALGTVQEMATLKEKDVMG